jgi:hypothetical protein
MQFLYSALCAVPAAMVGIYAQRNMHAGADMIVAVVFFSLIGSLTIGATVKCFMEFRFILATVLLPASLGLTAANLVIAFSGVSAVRDAVAASRIDAMKTEADKERLRDRILSLRKQIDNDQSGSQMVQAEMARYRKNGAAWKRLNVKFQTIMEIEKLQAQLDGWSRGTITESIGYTSSADPAVDNISALVAAILSWHVDPKTISALISLTIVIALQLGADIGPVALMVMFHSSPQHHQTSPRMSPQLSNNATKNVPIDVPNVPILAENKDGDVGTFAPSPPTAVLDKFVITYDGCDKHNQLLKVVSDWAKACIIDSAGSFITPTELYQNFQLWAVREKLPPISQKAFGATFSCIGFEREQSGHRRYIDISLRQTGLRVIK